jgi:hypothetical protein
MLFYVGGMLSLIILLFFYLTIHGFDIIWGGDIARGAMAERAQAMEMQAGAHMRPPP